MAQTILDAAQVVTSTSISGWFIRVRFGAISDVGQDFSPEAPPIPLSPSILGGPAKYTNHAEETRYEVYSGLKP